MPSRDDSGSGHAFLFILLLASITALLLYAAGQLLDAVSTGSGHAGTAYVLLPIALCIPLGWLAAKSVRRMKR